MITIKIAFILHQKKNQGTPKQVEIISCLYKLFYFQRTKIPDLFHIMSCQAKTVSTQNISEEFLSSFFRFYFLEISIRFEIKQNKISVF